MLIIKYHSNSSEGTIRKNLSPEEMRKICKSNFITFKKKETDIIESDSFNSLDLKAFYKNDKLSSINFFYGNKFLYKNINLFSNLGDLLTKFKENNIKYEIDEYGITVDNNLFGLFMVDFFKNETNPKFKLQKVRAVCVDFNENNCSFSFERLFSYHIPSKKCYEKSNISSDDGPSILIYYDHLPYFASHGKSKATKKYLEKQTELVKNKKVMEAIKIDINDVKDKTDSLYLKGIKQMKDYAIKLSPKDFIPK